MPAGLAKYACDECRSRKIRCSREAGGCTQCKSDARSCVYSRSGVIRRKARQSKHHSSSTTPNGNYESPSRPGPLAPTTGDLRSQLDEDIETIQDSLKQFGESDHDASGTLATLGEDYSSFWVGPSLGDMARELGVSDKKFLPFSDAQESLFTETFVHIQAKAKPFFPSTPPEILHDVRCNPDKVSERAHLVIVYGILLTDACLDSSYDKTTIAKLRWNLRLAIDDAKLLLEPSDLNIQALTLLACHVQEVSTPTLCYMMVSNACRMLQVLGINTRSLDPETRERRQLLFWLLNGADKGLALVSGRTPSFHRTMSSKIPLIPLQKMLDYQPHISAVGKNGSSEPFKSMFGAHLMRQIHHLSIVLSDIWSCLFEDGSRFDEVRKNLEDWWQQSSSILQACILAEQPFLEDAATRSMELGIKSQEFHYNYFKVVLFRSRSRFRNECVSSAQEALSMLDHLVADSNEVYNGVVWLLLYCPFTPFFILFGEILSKGNCTSSQRSLEGMEKFSTFLAEMRPRHPRAAKLYTIATTLVQYAKSVLTKRSTKAGEGLHKVQNDQTSNLSSSAPTWTPYTTTSTIFSTPSQISDLSKSPIPDQQPLQDLFNDPSVQALAMDWEHWLPNSQSWDGSGMEMGGMKGMAGTGNDPYGFFADSTFDWFSWDPNLGDSSVL